MRRITTQLRVWSTSPASFTGTICRARSTVPLQGPQFLLISVQVRHRNTHLDVTPDSHQFKHSSTQEWIKPLSTTTVPSVCWMPQTWSIYIFKYEKSNSLKRKCDSKTPGFPAVASVMDSSLFWLTGPIKGSLQIKDFEKVFFPKSPDAADFPLPDAPGCPWLNQRWKSSNV